MKPHEFDDDALNTHGQQAMRDLVSQLPEETLSLAWRSELNERLRAAQPQRRRRWSWLMKPAVGLAFAGALAVVAVVRMNVGVPSVEPHSVASKQAGSLEAALVRDHQDLVGISDVVGAGMMPDEASPTSTYSVDNSWNEYDLDSL